MIINNDHAKQHSKRLDFRLQLFDTLFSFFTLTPIQYTIQCNNFYEKLFIGTSTRVFTTANDLFEDPLKLAGISLSEKEYLSVDLNCLCDSLNRAPGWLFKGSLGSPDVRQPVVKRSHHQAYPKILQKKLPSFPDLHNVKQPVGIVNDTENIDQITR